MANLKTQCKKCICNWCKFKGDCHCPLKRNSIAPAICDNFKQKEIEKDE